MNFENDTLDISSLKKAINSLERSMKVSEKWKDSDIDEVETIRAGVIQNFEFTYL